jgi:hypothetical protein
MPIEPITTDEKIDGPAAKKKKDFEAHLMGGCMVIVISSVLVFGMSIWPFIPFPEYSVQGLKQIALFGAVPALVFAAIVSFRFGLAGGAGSVGGALAATIFIFLDLQQTMLGHMTVDLPEPEYPERWVWMVPLGYVLAFVVVALVCVALAPSEKPKNLDVVE